VSSVPEMMMCHNILNSNTFLLICQQLRKCGNSYDMFVQPSHQHTLLSLCYRAIRSIFLMFLAYVVTQCMCLPNRHSLTSSQTAVSLLYFPMYITKSYIYIYILHTHTHTYIHTYIQLGDHELASGD
jgi:hypothetical protein